MKNNFAIKSLFSMMFALMLVPTGWAQQNKDEGRAQEQEAKFHIDNERLGASVDIEVYCPSPDSQVTTVTVETGGKIVMLSSNSLNVAVNVNDKLHLCFHYDREWRGMNCRDKNENLFSYQEIAPYLNLLGEATGAHNQLKGMRAGTAGLSPDQLRMTDRLVEQMIKLL